MNKAEFKQIREEYRTVLLPKLRNDDVVCCLGKVWAKKTDYGRIVFKDNLGMEQKDFPDYFYEIGQPKKLNADELYRLKKIISKEKKKGGLIK